MHGRSWGVLVGVSLLTLGCGGSEFQSSDTGGGGSDAAAGNGGTSGAGGTTATGGAAGSAGTGGTATGGTAGSTGGTGGTGAAGTGGDPGSCSTECLPLPPGWHGPATFHPSPASEDPVTCSGFYGSTVAQGVENVFGEAATCHCECTADPSKILVQAHPDVDCGEGTCATTELESGQCVPPPTCPGVKGGIEALLHPESCKPHVKVGMPPVQVGSNPTICDPTDPVPALDCPDGAFCDPKESTPTCIWTEGDMGCPEVGPFNQWHGVYQQFRDERDCSECNCIPSGEAGNVSIFLGTSCENIDSTFTVPTACHIGPTSNLSRMKYVASNTLTCSKNGEPLPIGDVVLLDPITVCCR